LKAILSRLVLGLLLCGGMAQAAKAGGMFPYKSHVETLDNGPQGDHRSDELARPGRLLVGRAHRARATSTSRAIPASRTSSNT
jgi:hypothetical protein